MLLAVVVVVPAARLLGALARRRRRPPRVLWGPIPIVGIRYASLADRTQGISSRTLVYDVYAINAPADFDYVLGPSASLPAVGRLVPYAAFLWAALRFEIFCFYFDGGLLHATPWWRVELALLKAAGRGIVVLPYGGDARLPSQTRSITPWNIYSDIGEGNEDRDERSVLAHRQAFARFADVMLGCADIVDDLPRLDGVFRFPYQARAEVPERRSGSPIVVVHAPNHRHYKGTRFLVSAIDELRAEGIEIELDLVERVPNEEALRRYAAADIAADQFLAGAYALFAIEAMSLGKPVVCYLNDRFLPWHPEWLEAPILSASPDTLTEKLRLLATDEALRRKLGRAGPAYVERYHSLESVGRDLATIYGRLRAS